MGIGSAGVQFLEQFRYVFHKELLIPFPNGQAVLCTVFQALLPSPVVPSLVVFVVATPKRETGVTAQPADLLA